MVVESVHIPTGLKQGYFRFVKVVSGEKYPFEQKWLTYNNYHFADPELQSHLSDGGNYGVLGGYGDLLIIDADSPAVIDCANNYLPNTLEWWRGDPERRTYVFVCPDLKQSLRLTDEGENKGQVISNGQLAVGPGSIHPSGSKYRIYQDREIADVTKGQVKSALSHWLKDSDDSDQRDIFSNFISIFRS